MRRTTLFFVLLLLSALLLLTGCGSSGSGGTSAANSPFSSDGGGTTTGTTTPTTSQDPDVSLTLTTDLKQIDTNIGTVLLTAKAVNVSGGDIIDPVFGHIGDGQAIPNASVTFTVLAGPGSISYTTPVTDKNGVSNAIYTSGNVPYTTNVIIEATTTIDGKNYRAYTSFQIVRGTGVISIGENGQLPKMSDTVDPNIVSEVRFERLISFKVTDSNGNPRVGVPVTLSLYSQQGDSIIVIDYLKNPVTEPTQQTVTTDSSGMGIFNASVTMSTPSPGLTKTDSVVYKAVTNDAIPIVAYVGATYSVTAKLPTLVITPTSASFGTSSDITFTISGGVSPYTVTSSNPGRVSATLQPDGVTVVAHLVDTTQWDGSVSISAKDSASQTISATTNR